MTTATNPLRCYDCGQTVPENQIHRREVEIGRGAGVGFSEAGLLIGVWVRRDKVSLCEACFRRREEEEVKELESWRKHLVAGFLFLLLAGTVAGLLHFLSR